MALLRRRRAERVTDGTMSLMEHLFELRKRLGLAVLGILLGGIVGFIWYTVGIPRWGIPPLGELLIRPYCDVSSPPRIPNGPTGCSLVAITPFSIVGVRFKAAFMVGLILSSPMWLYQLWSFVTPALYDRERKFAKAFAGTASLLFVLGAAIAYAVIPEGLKVLLGFGGNSTVAQLTPDSYYSFLVSLLVIFGLSFEVPLILVMLNFAGVIKGAQLAKSRRYAIFGMVVLAALVVPGNDPITMSALALALAVLYEVAVQVTKMHDRRALRREAAEGLTEVDDDQASALTGEPMYTQAPAPIAPADPVSAPDRFGDAT